MELKEHSMFLQLPINGHNTDCVWCQGIKSLNTWIFQIHLTILHTYWILVMLIRHSFWKGGAHIGSDLSDFSKDNSLFFLLSSTVRNDIPILILMGSDDGIQSELLDFWTLSIICHFISDNVQGPKTQQFRSLYWQHKISSHYALPHWNCWID